MKNHEGTSRGFVWTSRAWYAQPTQEKEILFGRYFPTGGTSGEMAMRWKELGGEQTPRLCVYDDAWSALRLLSDVIEELAECDGKNITPEEFVEILLSCGFEDLTEYERDIPTTNFRVEQKIEALRAEISRLEGLLSSDQDER